MANIGIHVEGLREAIHAFEEFDAETPHRLRGELKDVAQQGSDMAAFIATARGDIYHGAGDHGDPARHDGDLVAKISVRKAGPDGYAAVEYSTTSTKKYPRYSYPRRIEYGTPGRAFMRPMADRMGPIAQARLDLMIDTLIAEKGLG